MVTFVGTQTTFADALKAAVELNYDIIAAYETAIEKLNNADYRKKLNDFKQAHATRATELARLLRDHQENVPDSASTVKQWLTKGKVYLATLSGDEAILAAMSSNEEDSLKAYERLNEREDKWSDGASVIKQGLDDVHQVQGWFNQVKSGTSAHN